MFSPTSAYDPISSMLFGLGGSFVILLLGMFVVYFVLLFFLGLMFYYFTGSKPGAHILHNFMHVMGRAYVQTWMFGSLFVGWYGLFSVIKAAIGTLFSSFVYPAYSRSATNDFQIGIVLVMFATVVYATHWGFNYILETKQERKGTFITKLFWGLGLALSSLFLFGSMLALIFEVLSFVQSSSIYSSVRPGGSLSLLIATMPVWGYYAFKTVRAVRHEQAKNK